jgi:hypothetical protein
MTDSLAPEADPWDAPLVGDLEALPDDVVARLRRIRARWSNGPTGQYPAGTEACDQADVKYLLNLVGA